MTDKTEHSGASVIQNQGSTARDHLANERTFLAWVRTSLGVVGLGVVVVKLVAEDAVVTELAGLIFIALGVVGLAYSLTRYRRVADHLQNGLFPIARVGPWALTAVALLVAAVATLMILR